MLKIRSCLYWCCWSLALASGERVADSDACKRSTLPRRRSSANFHLSTTFAKGRVYLLGILARLRFWRFILSFVSYNWKYEWSNSTASYGLSAHKTFAYFGFREVLEHWGNKRRFELAQFPLFLLLQSFVPLFLFLFLTLFFFDVMPRVNCDCFGGLWFQASSPSLLLTQTRYGLWSLNRFA